jgi:tRNA (guanine-N7-)-methyltransferase
MSARDGKAAPGAEGSAHPRRATYGRRRGRRLRGGQETLLSDLLPQLRVNLPQQGEQLQPCRLFGREPAGLWLEIGFGRGEHFAWQAARHPEVGLLGAEVFVDGIVALLRRVREGSLENLRIYKGDGRDLLDILPERSLQRVFILFPDPWPKRRHHKRRLLQQATLDRLAELMVAGAELRLATDHGDYLRWILERAADHPAFEWLARRPADWRQRPADWPATRYEIKALGQGRSPWFLRFRRRS